MVGHLRKVGHQLSQQFHAPIRFPRDRTRSTFRTLRRQVAVTTRQKMTVLGNLRKLLDELFQDLDGSISRRIPLRLGGLLRRVFGRIVARRWRWRPLSIKTRRLATPWAVPMRRRRAIFSTAERPASTSIRTPRFSVIRRRRTVLQRR